MLDYSRFFADHTLKLEKITKNTFYQIDILSAIPLLLIPLSFILKTFALVEALLQLMKVSILYQPISEKRHYWLQFLIFQRVHFRMPYPDNPDFLG